MSKGKKAACYRAVIEFLKTQDHPVSISQIEEATGYSRRMVRAQILQDARNDGQQIQEVDGGFLLEKKTFKYEVPKIVQQYERAQKALAAFTRAEAATAEAIALAKEALKDTADSILLSLTKRPD